jgi:two-component system CheB/CheR fusion protein
VPTRIEINEAIFGMVDLIQRAIGEHIELRMSLEPEPLWVLIDGSELENALLNLALNARDSMPNGGSLTITTKFIAETSGSAAQTPLPSSASVLVAVTDTGTGMAPSVLDRAFEPFFTTKPVGKGTGLGLSSIHGFVRQSQGQVWIDSKLQTGTTVNIQLPLGETAVPASIDDDDALPLAAGETILVVEDNPAVAALTRDHLATFGYRVLTAHNGPAAIRSLDAGVQIDLLFSDIIMSGGMSGYQLADRCAAQHPKVKILLTSGFPEAEGRIGARYARLDKPYTRAALARAVRLALQ